MTRKKITALVGVLLFLAAAAMAGLAWGATAWYWKNGPACYACFSTTVTQLGGDKKDTFVVAGGVFMGEYYAQKTLKTAKIWKGNAWGPSQGTLVHERHSHTATLLADNNTILFAGGRYTNTVGTVTNPYDLNTSEIFDTTKKAQAEAHQAVGALNEARSGHTATRLTVGPHANKVLVIGGIKRLEGEETSEVLTSCELYDPTAKTWSTTWASGEDITNLTTARYNHTATLLQDGTGRILVIGGFTTNLSDPTTITEIFDPKTNSWTDGPTLRQARGNHTATLLADGRVLVAGGSTVGLPGNSDLSSCEICEKDGTGDASKLFKVAATLKTARSTHVAGLMTADPYKDQVLVLGGGTDTCELYDPHMSTPVWSYTANFLPPAAAGQSGSRAFLAAFLTNPSSGDKRVIAVGGLGTKRIDPITTRAFTFEGTATFDASPASP
jgi:hypothetical protein